MLRILLIVPSLGLQTTSEVRDLTGLHRVTVLGDTVTARDVYQAARAGSDVIHYAGHSDENGVQLNEGESLDDSDLLQIARISGAKCIFFNSCYAGRLAHYLVGHGVPLAVHTNVSLEDPDAWKLPLAFYRAVDRLGNGRIQAYVKAYAESSDGEGMYGLAISPLLVSTWADGSSDFEASRRRAFSQRQWAAFIAVAGFVIWLLVLSIWAIVGGL